MTKNNEEIRKHLVGQEKRIDDLGQEWKSGDNNAHAAAGGKARDTPPGSIATIERAGQVPRPVLSEVESPFRYSRTSSVEASGVQLTVESHLNVPWKLN